MKNSELKSAKVNYIIGHNVLPWLFTIICSNCLDFSLILMVLLIDYNSAGDRLDADCKLSAAARNCYGSIGKS